MINKEKESISEIYSESFFDRTIKKAKNSSLDVAKILIKKFSPSSIIDVGCGCGIYLKAFDDLDIRDIIGYDGSENAFKKSLLPEKTKIHDLRTPLKLDKKYDLCVCIEVAEHIENKYSKLLINNLTSASDTIFFTAALPGQGGTNHINEQPRSFWVNLFKLNGFEYFNSLTQELKREMKTREVIWWITNNLMVFKKEIKHV